MENFDSDFDAEGTKCEVIDGIVYGEPRYEIIGGVKFIMSPAPTLDHSTIIGRLFVEFFNYIIKKNAKAAIFSDNTDVYFSEKEHFMPDLCIVCNPEIVKTRKKIIGVPDLIVEVLSESTMKNDIGKKKDIYEKYGVKEYWIVDPWSKRVEVYHLIDNKFELNEVYKVYTDEDSKTKTNIKVSIFDDLIIDINNIFKWWFDD